MESPRSSGNPSEHLAPPASPYPATIDPSPVDSNGTNSTEVPIVSSMVNWTRANPLGQIEEDAQVNQVGDGQVNEHQDSADDLNDLKSPDGEEILSPDDDEPIARVGYLKLCD